MIRVIQRRLIIPRGDTGTFTVPALSPGATGSVGVFTIFDPITKIRVFQKKVDLDGDVFNIEFSHGDTVNLQAGDYLWDIKFYKDPVIENGKVISGTEIDSYYAAFQTPKCEIRETGDDFMAIEGTPVKVEDLNIILAATQAANAAKIAAEASATEAAEKLEQMVAAIPTKISDLVDDSGHYTKPAEGIPASDLEETYLTEHQDLSNYVQKTDYASTTNAGVIKLGAGLSYNITTNQVNVYPATESDIKTGTTVQGKITPKTAHTAAFYGLAKAAGSDEKDSILPVGQYTNAAKAAIQAMLDVPSTADIPTNVSELTNDAGYLTQHQDVSGFATKVDTVLETTLSMNRKADSVIGARSATLGYNNEASGSNSIATGGSTVARGICSATFGYGTIATGKNSFVNGRNNYEDLEYPEWISGAHYYVGDTVTRYGSGFICNTETENVTFIMNEWDAMPSNSRLLASSGNGTSSLNRSNAYALDWVGNGYYAGDVYINCNTDSSGGTKVLSVADFATDLDIQNIINGGAGA